MFRYKSFALAFGYPEDKDLSGEYDRLFRAREIWLYAAEYLAKNEFQRSNYLSDIMGFYRAFGVEPQDDRPDSLASEFEFMHYLIFKRLHVLKKGETRDAEEKAETCFDAERKFFNEYLFVPAKNIAERILSDSENGFYKSRAESLIEFLESEKKILNAA